MKMFILTQLVSLFDFPSAVRHHLQYGHNSELGLQELDLCGCNRITDVSLKYAFRFLELRHLNLSLCQQVTHVGISDLAVNNPSIETLIMSNCHNLSDEGVVSFVGRLSRLKHLDLQVMFDITSIAMHFTPPTT
ncbi:hypothetical protein C0J52_17783 [Blattella germanica]|nr:hypothetical protein C0J52_17783 [Blattella germanica]